MTTTCPNCQSVNPLQASICCRCGHNLQSQTHTQVLPVAAQATPTTHAALNPDQIAQQALQLKGVGGVRTEVVDLQVEQTAIIIDYSGSMAERLPDGAIKLDAAKCGARNHVLARCEVDDRDQVAVIVFNNRPQVLAPLLGVQSHQQQLLDTIESISPTGGTDINEGLRTAAELLNEMEGVHLRILLLSDGQGGHPEKTASELKDRGVEIEVMGIGHSTSDVNESVLREVASKINGEPLYHFFDSAAAIVGHFTKTATKTQVR